jgi:hypothetical protein
MHFLPASPCSTCPALHIYLHFIVVTMSCETYKIWSFSSCSFLQPPLMSCMLGPNILLNTLFSKHQSVF